MIEYNLYEDKAHTFFIHDYIRSTQHRKSQHTSFLEIFAKLQMEEGCSQCWGTDRASDLWAVI